MAPRLRPEEELVLYGKSFGRPRPELMDAGFFEGHPRVRLVRGRLPNRLLQLLGGARRIIGLERFTGRLDIFLYTDFVYPPLMNTPAVIVLYDLLFLGPESCHRPAFCRTMTKRVGRALDRATGVVVPTESVRRDLMRWRPGLKIPIEVIPLGGDHLPAAALHADVRVPSGERFFLSVGTLEPRKNHLGLLEAFEAVADRLPGVNLIVAGRRGWKNAPFRRRLNSSPVKGRVHVLEEIDDQSLSWLYRHGLALVYPSFGEGFGLPVAEAMNLGCPVIASKRPALPEVAGRGALLVDPSDREALAEAMTALAEDPAIRAHLVRAGKDRAPSLTWARTAERILAFLRSLAGRPDCG